nr:rootletin-like [Symphalangus syndactylus]
MGWVVAAARCNVDGRLSRVQAELALQEESLGVSPIPSPACALSPRDLLQLGGELARTSRAVQEVGLGLSTGLQRAESWAEAALEKQALLQAQLEEQLRDKGLHEKDLAQQQMQSDLDKADLSARWVPGGCHTRQVSLQKSDRAGPGSGASSEAESGEGSGQQGPHQEI